MLLSIDVGLKNLALCGLHENKIIIWKMVNLTYGTDPCTSLIKEMDELTDTIQGSTIVIERQMTRKMTNIQCYLEMYFRLKGHSVIIYSPKHKLAGTGKEYSGAGKGLYHARKKASVQLCKEWLDKYPQEEQWIQDLWRTTKKKDDISDALMMAIAYQENPLPDVALNIKKVMARKPTAAQEKKGKYTQSSIKYLLLQIEKEKGTDSINNEANLSKKLINSIRLFWPDLQTCLNSLEIIKIQRVSLDS
jgi:hypothetical protein